MGNKDQTKRLETQRLNRIEYDKQTIVVDDNWKIVRADALNWQIQFKGQEKGYYGRLSHAFEALVDKILLEEAKTSLNDTLELVKAIRRRIIEALPNQ